MLRNGNALTVEFDQVLDIRILIEYFQARILINDYTFDVI